jgi:hypothetical protein
MARHQLLHKEILFKKGILDKTKVQLKAEFVGIDRVIEELIDNISSWYFFPSLQSKPVIINLWGLTGVGKSSLIKRLAQLISFEEKFYHFDLGASNDRGWKIKTKLEDIYENVNGYPVIIALDEFQHARTLDEKGNEMDKSGSRVVWELLDSGRFQVSRYSHQVDTIHDLVLKLKYFLGKGIVVKDGMVISNKDLFVKEMDLTKEYQQYIQGEETLDLKMVCFVPKEFLQYIYEVAREKFSSLFDLKKKLRKLNGLQTVDFLYKIFEFVNSPKTVDCSKALIFVLGNLDEAYSMSGNYNPDMEADEFHEQSLKINLTQIKSALQCRFRNEQISRLGNTHIIYPAFSRQSFYKIIQLELSKIKENVKSQQNIDLSFDESICDLIYKEGVYPTQGTRPVFTTIHQVINTKLGRVLTELILNKLNPSKIQFWARGSLVIVDYFNQKGIIYSFSEKQVLNLERLRKNRQDDMQAITAVHESGHAIMAIILLKTIPEIIYSVTANTNTQGFVYTKFHHEYVVKNEIENHLAMYLGGFAAEKIVFGEEYITTGAEEDIAKATRFATIMIKECGMGSFPASFQVKSSMSNNFIHDEKNIMNEESKLLIQNALLLAEKTLKDQYLLLLRMSDYLSDNRCMSKDAIKEMVSKYSKSFSINKLTEKESLFFYRNNLKNKIQALPHNENVCENNPGKFEISLNKTSDAYKEK